MKRLKYGLENTHNQDDIDPENPDTRPISLIKLYKSHPRAPIAKTSTTSVSSIRDSICRSNRSLSIQKISKPVIFRNPSFDTELVPRQNVTSQSGESAVPFFHALPKIKPLAQLPDVPKIPKRTNKSSLNLNKSPEPDLATIKSENTEKCENISHSTNKTFKVLKLDPNLNDDAEGPNNEEMCASTETARIISQNFIHSFIFEKSSETSAIAIQRAFRAYRCKVHWKKELKIRFSVQNRQKALVFSLWHLICCRPSNLRTCFRSAALALKRHSLYPKGKTFVPFPLFYITSRLFIPSDYTPDQIYGFVHLMNSPLKVRILRLWHYTTQKRLAHRSSLSFIRYPMKQQTAFGSVFFHFQLWMRLASWFKKARKQPKGFIKLDNFGVNVRWIVLEARLNLKRSRIERADLFHRKMTIKNGLLALFDRKISRASQSQVKMSVDRFRNKKLMLLAHRGWLKFLQMNSRDNQTKLDVIRAWYKEVYNQRDVALHKKIGQKVFHRFKVYKVLSGWYREARSARLQTISRMLSVQRSGSVCFLIIFLLRGDYEEFFEVLCFRTWLHFRRARKRWARFALWSHELDPNTEKKHATLCELHRAANLRLLGRLFNSTASFFPRQPHLSPELASRAVDECLQTELRETLSHWCFTTAAPKQVGKSGSQSQRPFSGNGNDWEALGRAMLICVLNKAVTQRFFLEKKKNIAEKLNNASFEKERTYTELTEQCRENTKIMRLRLTKKLTRDQSVLNGLVSHIAAEGLQKEMANFTSAAPSDLLQLVRANDNDDLSALYVFPDVKESIAAIEKQLRESRDRVLVNCSVEKAKMQKAFNEHLRNPSVFMKKQTSHFAGLIGAIANLAQGSVNAVVKNPAISVFVPSVNPDYERQRAMLAEFGLSSLDSDSTFKISPNIFSRETLHTAISSGNYDAFTSILLIFFEAFCRTPLKLGDRIDLSFFSSNTLSKSLKNNHNNSSSHSSLSSAKNLASSSNFSTSTFLLSSNPNMGSATNSTVNLNPFIISTSATASSANLSSSIHGISSTETGTKTENANANAQNEPGISNEPNGSERDSSDFGNLSQLLKHRLRKNAKYFMNAAGDGSVGVKPSMQVNDSVSAVLTVFDALKGSPLECFLDPIPFSSEILAKFEDGYGKEIRVKLWEALKMKQPDLKPVITKEMNLSLSAKKDSRSSLFGSLSSIPQSQNLMEVVDSNEALIICFLLPLILGEDMIAQLIGEEIVPQIKT